MGLIVGQSRSKRHGFAFRRPGMALRNGTRRDLWPELRHMLSEIDELPNVGRENRPLARSREIAQEIVGLKLAERVGVIARDFRKPNVYSGFWLISRNGNDLASSNLRLHFRPFTGACRFFYFDDTRNGTRRDGHRKCPRSQSTGRDGGCALSAPACSASCRECRTPRPSPASSRSTCGDDRAPWPITARSAIGLRRTGS